MNKCEEQREDVHALTRDDIKQAAKSAIKEWLSENVQKFGWWSIKTLAALAFAAAVYFILVAQGWRTP